MKVTDAAVAVESAGAVTLAGALGVVVSTVQDAVTACVPAWPAASVCLTARLWGPSARPVRACGLVQGA